MFVSSWKYSLLGGFTCGVKYATPSLHLSLLSGLNHNFKMFNCTKKLIEYIKSSQASAFFGRSHSEIVRASNTHYGSHPGKKGRLWSAQCDAQVCNTPQKPQASSPSWPAT